MESGLLVLWILLLTAGASMGEETVFSKTKLMATEGRKEKLVEVSLRFSDTSVIMTDKKTLQTLLTGSVPKVGANELSNCIEHNLWGSPTQNPEAPYYYLRSDPFQLLAIGVLVVSENAP